MAKTMNYELLVQFDAESDEEAIEKANAALKEVDDITFSELVTDDGRFLG